MKTHQLASLFLATLIISGISQQATAADIDPCSYLTSDEIETVLGWKVATTDPKPHGATGSCKYKSATPYSAQGMQIIDITIGRGMPELNSNADMVAWRKKQYEGDAYKDMPFIVEPVEGLGVPAIFNGMEGLLSIEMKVGDKLITVASVDTRDKARKLGEMVLAHAK